MTRTRKASVSWARKRHRRVALHKERNTSTNGSTQTSQELLETICPEFLIITEVLTHCMQKIWTKDESYLQTA